MRKITALVLALMLALSTSAIAFAEEIPEYTVEVFEGPTYAFEAFGFQLTIPEVLAQVEVPEELAESGLFDMFQTADGSAHIQLLEVQFETAEELNASLEALRSNADVKDLEFVKFNGIPWATYSIAENDMAVAMTDMNDNMLLNVIGYPASDEGFMAVFMGVLGSIAPLAE